ncbi:MAG: Gfo/Idh/MocA family oxidoreductase [Gammaproteobacteria bacterium]|nr:Gfo/Idh/MocA family oxidoreductase [Gammaproteobacteria bacterium]
MTSKPVRIAVIGAGGIGRKHIELIASDDACTLHSVVDPAPTAASLAADHGVAHFADIATMLAAGELPDGAVIATPNHLHREAGERCAQAGVHLLVEKPIADTLTAAQALADTAEQHGVALLVGHHRRHNPILIKARELINAGAIGPLTAVTATWLLRKHDAYYEAQWRREQGGGFVLINLIHEIDNLRFMAGEIDAVQAIVSNARRGFEVADTAAVLLRFSNGALGTLTASDTTPSSRAWEINSGENPDYPHQADDCYLFSGTQGSLTVPGMKLWQHPGEPSWFEPLQTTDHSVPAVDPLVAQLQHFADVIRGAAQPVITGNDAVRTLAATLAITDSARSGEAIHL